MTPPIPGGVRRDARTGWLVLAASALVGVSTASASAAPAGGDAATPVPTLAGAIVRELNEVRAARGLRPLRVSPELRRAALAHSRSMAVGGFFAHDAPGGATFGERIRRHYPRSRARSWSAGENLLWASPDIGAGEAVEQWLASAPHRANVLRPAWRDVGVGAVHVASAGGYFGGRPAVIVTVAFGTRRY